jgi:hypothetical protein
VNVLVLGGVVWGLILCALICMATGRITTGYGVLASAYAFGAVAYALSGSPGRAIWDAVFAAFFGWVWWNRGGGNGPRRRLRRAARAFRGVRRTAPAAEAARSALVHRNGRTPAPARARIVHTTSPRPKEAPMSPLMAAVLAAPLAGTLAGVGCRHAARTWSRWAR